MIPEIRKILYSTDLGDGSSQVFRYAISLARQYGARIDIVKAAEPLSTFGQSLVELHISHDRSEEIHNQGRLKAKEDIQQRLHEFCKTELSVAAEGEDLVDDIFVIEGQPYTVIVEQARRIGADVIVMGSHRHSVVGEAMLGTTAQKVLHISEIPVLVVRIRDEQNG